jgi:hypothetical protein
MRLDFFHLPYPLGELWDENLVYVGPMGEDEEAGVAGPDDPELVRELEPLMRHPRALVRWLALDALARLEDDRTFLAVVRRSGRGNRAAIISEAQLLDLARMIWLGTFDRRQAAPAAWAAWRQLAFDAWKVGDATPGWIDRVSVLFAPEDWLELLRQIDDMPWPVARYVVERAAVLVPRDTVGADRLEALRRALLAAGAPRVVSVPPTSEWRAQWACWELADLDRRDPRFPLVGAQAIRWLEMSGQAERAEGLSALFRQWVPPDHVLFDQIAVPPEDGPGWNVGVVRQAVLTLQRRGVLGRLDAEEAKIVDFLAEILWDLVPLYLDDCPAPMDAEAWGLAMLALARTLTAGFADLLDRSGPPPDTATVVDHLQQAFAEEFRHLGRRVAPLGRRTGAVAQAVETVLADAGLEFLMRLAEVIASYGPFDTEEVPIVPSWLMEVVSEEDPPSGEGPNSSGELPKAPDGAPGRGRRSPKP